MRPIRILCKHRCAFMVSVRLVPILVLLLVGTVEAFSLLPLDTQDAVPLPSGKVEIHLGTEYLNHFRPIFRDFERRDQLSAPHLDVNVGAGSRVEIQFRYELLYARDQTRDGSGTFSKYGSGDSRFFTKVRIFSAGEFDRPWVPAAAFHFGVKLPDANFLDHLGTDQTDFFGQFLLSKEVFGGLLLANLGSALLGNPGPTRGQDDLFLYKVAAVTPEIGRWARARLVLLGEVTGSEGSHFDNARRGVFLGNNRHDLRAGLQLGSEFLEGYVGASAGLDSHSENFGVRAGILWRFQAFSD